MFETLIEIVAVVFVILASSLTLTMSIRTSSNHIAVPRLTPLSSDNVLIKWQTHGQVYNGRNKQQLQPLSVVESCVTTASWASCRRTTPDTMIVNLIDFITAHSTKYAQQWTWIEFALENIAGCQSTPTSLALSLDLDSGRTKKLIQRKQFVALPPPPPQQLNTLSGHSRLI